MTKKQNIYSIEFQQLKNLTTKVTKVYAEIKFRKRQHK